MGCVSQMVSIDCNTLTLFFAWRRTFRHRDIVVAVHRLLLNSRRWAFRHDDIILRIYDQPTISGRVGNWERGPA